MNKFNKAYIFIFAAGCLWGTMGFFSGQLSAMGIEPLNIAFLRLSSAAAILLLVLLFKGGMESFKIDLKGVLVCLALGVLCQGCFNFSYNEALVHIGVASAAVLLYTAPVFVTIMARIFFKEKITKAKVIALIINIIGCTLTVSGGDFSNVSFSLYGTIIGTVAGFLYGLMTIISSTTTDKYDPMVIVFYSFLVGAAVLAWASSPWAVISSEFASQGGLKFSALYFGYGLIPTVGAYLVYMKGLNLKPETSKVPVIASVETIVASLIGLLIFSEDMGLVKVIGIGLVILSIAVLNMKKEDKSNV